jgi:hypothetical protein
MLDGVFTRVREVVTDFEGRLQTMKPEDVFY